MDAETIIRQLQLQPHPEGGYFREMYRSDETLTSAALPGRYGRTKPLSTAIYFLLTPETRSVLHRLTSDEVYHFYLGDPVTLLQLYPGGGGRRVTLGPDLAGGQHPQYWAPREVWQGLYLNAGGRFALLGTTVAPGFDFADLEFGDGRFLCENWPSFRADIERLTPAVAMSRR